MVKTRESELGVKETCEKSAEDTVDLARQQRLFEPNTTAGLDECFNGNLNTRFPRARVRLEVEQTGGSTRTRQTSRRKERA